jgi:predicted aminopeptidase
MGGQSTLFLTEGKPSGRNGEWANPQETESETHIPMFMGQFLVSDTKEKGKKSNRIPKNRKKERAGKQAEFDKMPSVFRHIQHGKRKGGEKGEEKHTF